MVRWGAAIGKFNLFTVNENINMERKLAEAEKLKVQKCMDARRVFADQTAVKVNQLDEEHKRQNRIFENTIARIVNKNQTCFFTTKLSTVFLGWKSYMDRRRKCCKVLSEALRKTALQRTFKMINDHTRATDL